MPLKGFRKRRVSCWICWSVASDGLELDDYLDFSKDLPTAAIAAVEAAWGKAEDETGLREAPPSVLPDISPARGEIALSSRLSPIANVAGSAGSGTANLPP